MEEFAQICVEGTDRAAPPEPLPEPDLPNGFLARARARACRPCSYLSASMYARFGTFDTGSAQFEPRACVLHTIPTP
eukprot:1297105-Prymnesium_polylepis.1